MFIEFNWSEQSGRKISLSPYEIIAVFPFDENKTRINCGHTFYDVDEPYETVIQKINAFME